MVHVEVTNRQRHAKVNRRLLRRLAQSAAADEWGDCALSVVVVGEDEIARLNRRFLGEDGATDVLAFPLSDADASSRPLVGEVVVSGERASVEGPARGLSAEEEMALYVVHGVLHLAGWDDHDPAGRQAMRRRERRVLAGFGLRRSSLRRGAAS
jgi:probable rRNA maturation factor